MDIIKNKKCVSQERTRYGQRIYFKIIARADTIKAEYPEIPAYETYDELYAAIKGVIEAQFVIDRRAIPSYL